MAKEAFIQKNFTDAHLAIIRQANAIIADYQAQGFTLTLRQLYYQFVARALIPNKQTEYKRLGSIINDARLAGKLDWDAIEDRVRTLEEPKVWESPDQILRVVADQYQEDPWRNQKWAPEVWIEKDALVGVIEPVCERNRVAYLACRGYTSQSIAYQAGKRHAATARDTGRKPIVFHLGDHDPSGLDMTRDNDERVSMFARFGVRFVRLALNMEQIEQYGPPPNPAKETDARFTGYQAEFGDESWELDALEPTVIDALIQEALDGLKDQKKWAADMAGEEERKAALEAVSENWEDVQDFLREL